MKVSEKLVRAKEVIRFISTHDDEPEQVDKALDELTAFIQSEKKEAAKRRKEKEAAKAKE